MYPDNAEDRYKAERVVDIITNDCKFYTDKFFSINPQEQDDWVTKRAEEKLEPFLDLINRNCSPNIKQYGWAATSTKSIADVALLTWIASVIFNFAAFALGSALRLVIGGP